MKGCLLCKGYKGLKQFLIEREKRMKAENKSREQNK